MLELLTPEEMAKADKAAVGLGTPVSTLMESAGAAVVDAIRARYAAQPVLVLCGTGNNGGDGYVAARRLREAGWQVEVRSLGAPSGAAADAAARWSGAAAHLPDRLPESGLIVDALFGAGLSRPLEGAAARLAEAADPARVVAIDLPSGVRGDGRVLTPSFSAGLTVTFARKKPAHVLYPARALCGTVVLADIGVPEAAIEALGARAWENQPGLWRSTYPWPNPTTHKHARGRVAVASGGPARTGAARLAARGALRIGAGWVTVLSPPSAVLVNAAHLTAIMVESVEARDLAARGEGFDAMVIGPAFGLGEATQAAVAALAALGRPLVLDADALSTFADDPTRLFSSLHGQCVLTPHAGEFQRLFPDLAAHGSKLEATQAASARAGCVVVYKGPDTVIAAPDGRAAVNTNAPPYLATAGTGDVLAGMIAGLTAQKAPAWEAACAAVFLHGDAAARFGPGLIAEDLPDMLPEALRALR